MVVNHMCSIDGTGGTGSGGSFYDTSTLTFPHYSEDDFNCCQAYDEGNCLNGAQCDTSSCGIQNYNDVEEVRKEGCKERCSKTSFSSVSRHLQLISN